MLRIFWLLPGKSHMTEEEMMNKQESRYANTTSLMDEALLLLLEEKEFDRITVKELCQKTGVNRTTFYLHYDNMNDLLDETVEMINERFRESYGIQWYISRIDDEHSKALSEKMENRI